MTAPLPHISNELLKSMKDLSRPGIFCILAPRKKKIDIRSSANIGKTIQGLIQEAVDGFLTPKELRRDLLQDRIEISVLEEVKNPQEQLLRKAHWVQHFQDAGYEFYRDQNKTQARYKVVKDLVIDQTYPYGFKYLVHVSVKNSKRKTPVGLFSSLPEADRFIQKYYSDPIVKKIVYANNELTMNYFKRKYSLSEEIALNKGR